MKEHFSSFGKSELYKVIDEIKEFRNTYVAHQEQELKDKEKARAALKKWIAGLLQIYRLHHK